MNIVIFGATGKTGLEMVKQGLAQGHQVTAFIRDPSKLVIEHDHLRSVVGDVFDPASISRALVDQDAVLVSLGSQSLRNTTVRSVGTQNIIAAMKAQGLTRLLVVTAMGCHESWSQLGWFAKLFFITMLRQVKKDTEIQEDFVRASDLDWTIIRPSGLTDGPKTENYQYGTERKLKAGRIARADVADFMLKQISDDHFVKQAVAVT